MVAAHHVIAAGHAKTAAAAEAILRAGGNAFDAAVAAMAAACVAEPVLASLGGGGFALACPVDAPPRVYDFFVDTPLRQIPEQDLDFYPVTADFGTQTQEFHIGRGSIATPGFVAGAFALQSDLGRMSMPDLFAPAIALANEGEAISAFEAYLFSIVKPIYLATAQCRETFASKVREGELVGEGEVLRQPLLGGFLDVLALEGKDLFYHGEVAQMNERDLAGGGQLSRRDLENYAVEVRKPLSLELDGVQILTNPPPSSGGALCSFALSLVDARELHAIDPDDVRYALVVADVLQATREARIEAMAAGDDGSLSGLLDPGLLGRYRNEVMGRLAARRGTTHISIIDAAGNLAAVTVSNGEGSGYMVPDTGVVMNNMLGESDLNPSGFHRWQVGQRMTSMMMPTAVRWPDGTQVATGSGGSNRIRTALLQVLLRMIVHRNTPEAAVLAPRLHYEHGLLSIEGGFEPDRIAPLLQAWPEHQLWESRNLFFGGAHTVRSGAHVSDGIGDPRRAGVFLRVPG